MMQTFFPAIPGYTCFFLISLMDSSAQSKKYSTGQKDIYIIRLYSQIVLYRFCQKEVLIMLNKSKILSLILTVIHAEDNSHDLHNKEYCRMFMSSQAKNVNDIE